MRRKSLAADRLGEVERYRRISRETDVSADPLAFWKSIKRADFPTLSNLAHSILCIPASSATSERVFSTANMILSKTRTSLLSVASRSACMIAVNKSLISTVTELPNLSEDQIKLFFEGDPDFGGNGENSCESEGEEDEEDGEDE